MILHSVPVSILATLGLAALHAAVTDIVERELYAQALQLGFAHHLKYGLARNRFTATLHDRLATLGGQMIVQALEQAGAGALTATPQPANGVTYARKIDKAEALIDWRQPAGVIERRMRAFNPAPGTVTTLDAVPLKLFCSVIDSCLHPSDKGAGTILLADQGGIAVQCGDGVLRITELQRTGGKRLPAAEFLRGTALVPGTVLGRPAGSAAA